MVIGVPKEIKTLEHRVALLPGGVTQLVRRDHKVLIEKNAGEGSGFSDELYEKVGAEIVEDPDELWAESDMIMKVKEPIDEEYDRIQEDQIIFTYFHFAASEQLTDAIIDSNCVAIAYETVEKVDGSLPLLIPMSEVAGRMATQEGAKYLERATGGKGVLLGGIPGVPPATVLVIGGGIVGVNSAKVAAGMGANTTIMDIDMDRLRYLDDVMAYNVNTMFSSEANIKNMLPEVDLLIGAVLKHGAKAPTLISRKMLQDMVPGTVMVDVAIDQGGCFETSRPTTHDDPVYEVDGIVHYCVANMPGAVPYTSTIGLTNMTLPYAIQLADKGWEKACSENAELKHGLNIINGEITYQYVAEAFDKDWTPVDEFLES